jgi:hypothetical protein
MQGAGPDGASHQEASARLRAAAVGFAGRRGRGE